MIRAELRPALMAKASGNGQSIIINKEQLREIQSLMDDRYKVLTSIMFYCGTRVSECIQLRWVDVVNRTLVIRKGNTKGKEGTREIPISEELERAIMGLPQINSYLFSGRDGVGHLSRYSVDKKVRSICEELSIQGFSTHGFRRSFITNLARNNIHTKLIMTCSGHKQMSSVEKYIETTEEEKKLAVASLW
jgi:integrase/recombinase XerD